jgi:hypothetical protein
MGNGVIKEVIYALSKRWFAAAPEGMDLLE